LPTLLNPGLLKSRFGAFETASIEQD